MLLSTYLPTDIPTRHDGVDKFFEVINPATEEVIAQVCDTDSTQWLSALARAHAAQSKWAEFSPREKSEILRTIYSRIAARRDDFARTMTLEMGKPLAEAGGEVDYANEYFRWFTEEAVRIPGRITPAPAGGGHIVVTHQPVGVVLAITPWNFPLAMAARKIAPALAAGCPILIKPAQLTPLTMLLAGKIIKSVLAEANAPTDLIHILPTTDATNFSATLLNDSRLRKLTFTGSTAVGKTLVELSARNLVRTSMELGGNAPFLIHHDADLDLVLECAMQAKMRNGGQACIAANRFLVHESIAADFSARLVAKMQAITLGNGLDSNIQLGPLISQKQRDQVAELVTQSVDDGAIIRCGGTVASGKGFFYPATVLDNVSTRSRIFNEEIFGPVATITTFSTLEQGIKLANDTAYGLAAYGFSENVHTAHHLATALTAGMVGINKGAISDAAAPFGGIKESGFGREGGQEGILEYLDTKYISL
ncbi:NAD-dependent succinate-semialdehyde dehydrogenase [Corynebacterium kutscheri]|uniref:Succinate-semialdehyde dehydrogenase n=1 Tax=Corynebacterium kutscheri TaxID=35755 RepID=A0AB38VSB9_9CORY|nr:NAD-dependent succinate-semialdehyde dehydrogenase [Corynebacterium kutscheri]VEH05719.1 putative succinate-semialdehyde dehydrogenase [Corynebacterium kutscheri]